MSKDSKNIYEDMNGEVLSTNADMPEVDQNTYADMTGAKRSTYADMSGVAQSIYTDMAGDEGEAHNPMYVMPDKIPNKTQNEKTAKGRKPSNSKQNLDKSGVNTDVIGKVIDIPKSYGNDAYASSYQPGVEQNPYADMTGVKQDTYADMTGVKQDTYADMSGVADKIYTDMTGEPQQAHNPMYVMPDKIPNNNQKEQMAQGRKPSNSRQNLQKSRVNADIIEKAIDIPKSYGHDASSDSYQRLVEEKCAYQNVQEEPTTPETPYLKIISPESFHEYQRDLNKQLGYDNIDPNAKGPGLNPNSAHKVSDRASAVAAIESVYILTEADEDSGSESVVGSTQRLNNQKSEHAQASDQETYDSLHEEDITAILVQPASGEPSRGSSQHRPKRGGANCWTRHRMVFIAVILGFVYLLGVIIIVASVKQAQPVCYCEEQQQQQKQQSSIPVTDSSTQLKACEHQDTNLFTFDVTTTDLVQSGKSAVYICNENYVAANDPPNRHASVVCKEGKWDPEPACLVKTTTPLPTTTPEPMTCTETDSAHTDTVIFESPGRTVRSGKSTNYDCKQGLYSVYNQDQNFDRTTCNNGTWQPLPKCE